MLKRPSADETARIIAKKGKFVETMKKPAAAGGLKATIGKMKAGCEEEQHDEEELPSDEDAGDSARDKGKGEKFAAMLRSDSLPPHIKHLYNEVAKSKSSPRDFRTQVINSLFERKANGRFQLRDDKPLFTEVKELYERKYSTDRALAYPRSVMKGLYFQNSETAFQAALDCGDIQEVEDPTNPNSKVKYFAYRKLETGKETGTNHKSKLTRQSRPNAQAADLLADMYSSLGWKFSYRNHEKIESGKLPASMSGLLNEAIDAQTKMQADALKLIPLEHTSPENWKSLKANYVKSTQNQADMKHLVHFKEHPDGSTTLSKASFDEFMLRVATETQKFLEDVEAAKGRLK
ncbi:unnamed protein product, partial [Symbiodinium necroappetens]